MREVQPGGDEPAIRGGPRPRMGPLRAASRGALRALALGLLLAIAAGCGGDYGPQEPENTATIRVQNDFGGSVLRLFLKGCGSASWGSDRLGSQETIDPGASRDFTVEAGCWDVGADVFTKPFDQNPTEEDLRRAEVFETLVAEGDVETVVLQREPTPQ